MSYTEPCGRRGCENKRLIPGCLRSFFDKRVLCDPCREIYCASCCGNLTWRQITILKNEPGMPHYTTEHPVNCARCGGTGRLTERQLAQKAAMKALEEHECSVCDVQNVVAAYEDYEIYVGERQIGSGNRTVYVPRERCQVGSALWSAIIDLGADVDGGAVAGFDGLDWAGEPREKLQPGYREVVTFRRDANGASLWHNGTSWKPEGER